MLLHSRSSVCLCYMYSTVGNNPPPVGVPVSCAPLLPMGAWGRLVCVVVRAPRCAVFYPALRGPCLVNPHRVVPLCACVGACLSSGSVVLACAGPLWWFGILAWHCTGQCGLVVPMTLLSLAYLSLNTVSRSMIFWKVMCVDVRLM